MSLALQNLKHINAARVETLQKELSITTVSDLLYYFPRRYLDRTLNDTPYLQAGQEITLIVRVSSTYLRHGRMSHLIVHAVTNQGVRLSLIWFRRAHYFHKLLTKDMIMVVSAKLEYYHRGGRGLQMIHPDFEILNAHEEKELIHTGRIIPLYTHNENMKKNGLDSRGLRHSILSILDMPELISLIAEVIPLALLEKHALTPRQEALRAIHFPNDYAQLDEARRRLKYEELYLFQILMYHKSRLRQKTKRQLRPLAFGQAARYTNLLKQLPFQLTHAQEQALQAILNDCQQDHAGAFLLQGDVGSGKTLVALAVALHYWEAGIQSALLAPTEILARQHFITISKLVGLQDMRQIELISGADSKKERLSKLERIASGDTALAVGTHALLQANIVFKDLGLIIIDEQHRFGVKQREALTAKAKNPDTIAMSATPIPRSLCLSEFADLKLVTLKQKPAGRKPVQTMWFTEQRRKGVYNSIRKHVQAGRQAYIVYPLIEESEKIDLAAAADAYQNLSAAVFPEFRLELLHGRLKNTAKESIMRKFVSGEVQILITTSVVEVGVDVPNATIMLIEHAERFGISQLHQLRGRVGRGSEQSYCVLMSNADGADTQERLQALVDSQDGFYLAEMDLKLRGSGEILGLRQHGLSELRLANLVRDSSLVTQTFADAQKYPQPNTAGHAFLCQRFSQGIVIFPN